MKRIESLLHGQLPSTDFGMNNFETTIWNIAPESRTKWQTNEGSSNTLWLLSGVHCQRTPTKRQGAHNGIITIDRALVLLKHHD